MKQIKMVLGGMVLAMAVGVGWMLRRRRRRNYYSRDADCRLQQRLRTQPTSSHATPMPSPTPIAETDFVGFVHELFAETSDTTEPQDINDLNFSNLNAGPDAFDDLLK